MFEKLRREWHLRDINKRVRRHGWMPMYVGDYEASPCWAYSIGFEESLGQPEVIVFDVTQADANSLLWWVYKSIESGELLPRDGEAWAPEGDLIGVWREVHATQIKSADGWFAAAEERRERRGAADSLRALQLVFRDGAEKFPWEEGYDEGLRTKQPALYQAATDYGQAPLSSVEREALRVADERGWSLMLVDAPLLKWAYSIGLADAGSPELIAFLPSINVAANILHETQAYLARGDLRLEDGLRWDGLEIDCCWRRVHESQYLALNVFFLTKLRHEHRHGKRGALEAYQLFLPDREGRYPWEHGCEKMMRDCQPLLYQPFDPEMLRRGPLAALMRM